MKASELLCCFALLFTFKSYTSKPKVKPLNFKELPGKKIIKECDSPARQLKSPKQKKYTPRRKKELHKTRMQKKRLSSQLDEVSLKEILIEGDYATFIRKFDSFSLVSLRDPVIFQYAIPDYESIKKIIHRLEDNGYNDLMEAYKPLNILHWCAEKGALATYQLLRKKGVKFTKNDLKQYPLHLVASHQDDDNAYLMACLMLKEMPKQLNHVDTYGYSPLAYALKKGKLELSIFFGRQKEVELRFPFKDRHAIKETVMKSNDPYLLELALGAKIFFRKDDEETFRFRVERAKKNLKKKEEIRNLMMCLELIQKRSTPKELSSSGNLLKFKMENSSR